MILNSKDVRKEVLCENLSSLMCPIVGFARGRNFAEQPSEMDKRFDDLRTRDRVVQGEQPPRKVSARESQNKQKTGDTSFSSFVKFKTSGQWNSRHRLRIIQGNLLALLATRCLADGDVTIETHWGRLYSPPATGRRLRMSRDANPFSSEQQCDRAFTRLSLDITR